MILIVNCITERLAEFRKLCDDNQIDIVDFVKIGPSGGNPQFTLIADQKYQVDLISSWYFG